MVHVVVAAREHVVAQVAATPFQPRDQRLARRLHQLELDRPFGFLLHYNRAVPDASACHDVTDANLDRVAAAQLAVDGEVEQCAVTQPPVLVQEEADCPHLLRLEGSSRT